MSITITVSRQLGSRGSYIATAVAKQLSLRYIDRDLLQRAAELAGFPDEEMVAYLEDKEKIPGLIDQIITALNRLPPIPTIPSASLRESYAYDEMVAMMMAQDGLSRDEALQRASQEARRAEAAQSYPELIQQVILDYAQQGDVIIVGRGGQAILQDMPGVLHVQIIAPEPRRVHTLMERLGLDEKEAERRIRQSDKERGRYIKHFFGKEWREPTLYDLVVNTGKIPLDLAVHVICEAANRITTQLPA